MAINLRDVESCLNRVIYQRISNAGSVRSSFTFLLGDIPNNPDFCIIREVQIGFDVADATHGLLLVRSNLNDFGRPLFAVSGSVPSCSNPETVIPLKKQIDSIEFVLNGFDASGNLTVPVLANNWDLTISLDFVRMKKGSYSLENKSEY